MMAASKLQEFPNRVDPDPSFKFTLEDFELGELLGEGSYARVFFSNFSDFYHMSYLIFNRSFKGGFVKRELDMRCRLLLDFGVLS